MGFIPKITCRKCGRQYSGLKNNCPYCGTKRVRATARTPVTTAAAKPGTAAANRASVNTRWQAIFGIILLIAVVAAVIVLITVSLDDAEPEVTPTLTPTTPVSTPTPPPTPTPSPTPTVTSITISYFTEPKTEFSMSVGGQVPLTATVYPLEVEATATWRSTDESICTVDENGVVTGVSPGWGSVIAECGGVAAECKVLVQ